MSKGAPAPTERAPHASATQPGAQAQEHEPGDRPARMLKPVLGSAGEVGVAAAVVTVGAAVVGVVAAGVVAAGVVVAEVLVDVVLASTTIVPCMNGWIWQT